MPRSSPPRERHADREEAGEHAQCPSHRGEFSTQMSERGRRWLYSIVTVDLGWVRGRDWRGDEHRLIVDLGYGDFNWDRVKHCD